MKRIFERLVLIALRLAVHSFRLLLLRYQAQLRKHIKADTILTAVLEDVVLILGVLLRRHLFQLRVEQVILNSLYVAIGAVLESEDHALRR